MNHKSQLLVKSLFVAVPLSILLFFACNKGTNNAARPSYPGVSVTLEQVDTLENGLILPVGSLLSISPDSPKFVHVTYPDHFRFVGSTLTDDFLELQSFNVTCTCGSGGSCSPFATGQATGCVTTGNCTKCTQTQFGVDGKQLFNGITLDLSTGIHFITNAADLQSTRPITEAMLADPTVIQAMQSFIKDYQVVDTQLVHQATDGSLPASYGLMPISVFGRSVLVPVQKDITQAYMDLQVSTGAITADAMDIQPFSAYTCSCSAGGGCNMAHSITIPFMGSVHYCSAGGCSSCTLGTP